MRLLLAALAAALATSTAAAHDGPPYPILVDEALDGWTLSVWADPDVGEEDRVADDGSLRHPTAGGEDASLDLPLDAAPMGQERIGGLGSGQEKGGRPVAQAEPVKVRSHLPLLQADSRIFSEKVHVAAPVLFDGAAVSPIPLMAVTEDTVAPDHAR